MANLPKSDLEEAYGIITVITQDRVYDEGIVDDTIFCGLSHANGNDYLFEVTVVDGEVVSVDFLGDARSDEVQAEILAKMLAQAGAMH